MMRFGGCKKLKIFKKLGIIFLLSLLISIFRLNVVYSSESGGVGMILDHDPQGVIVLSVSPNSPAERGMIKKGDRLMKVEGMEVKGLNLSQIAEKIVGPVGSSVKLSLVSRGIEREVILQRVSLVELQPYQFPSADSDSSLTLAERDKIKAKIQTLTTREQRIKMQQLLQSFKDKKISKTQLFQSLDKEF